MKNLIKLYLWPLIKRFKALFITMAALTAVGVTAIIAFNGVSSGMVENYERYRKTSQAPQAFINTSVANYETNNRLKEISKLKGVDEVESYVYLPCSTRLPKSAKRPHAETKSTQLFTFDKDYDKYQPTIYEKERYKKEITNVYVEKAFAKLNNISANDTIEIGYFEEYIKCNVCGILSYPDTVVYGASNALSTENTNFGRIYIEKSQIKWLYNDLVSLLESRIEQEKRTEGNDLGLWDAEIGESLSDLPEYTYQLNDYFTIATEGNRLPNNVSYDPNAGDDNYVERKDEFYQVGYYFVFDGTNWALTDSNPNYKSLIEYVELAKKFKGFISDESQAFANRLTVYFKSDANQRLALGRIKTYLKGQGIKVTESYIFDDSLSASLIDSSSSAMKSAGAAISIFVFATTIIVLTMFLLQIIREMMRDIGVMQALGIQKEHIMVLLSLFSLIMAVIGTALGIFLGHLIELGLDKIVGGVFGIAAKAPPLRWKSSLIAFGLVLAASQLATLFASLKITKLTPVDALNDQASSKKVLPPSVDKKLQNSSPALRLTVNSIVTKPKRFVTSFLAIFSTAVIIFTSIASLFSFQSALNNIFSKYIRYEAQVIFAGDVPEGFEGELRDMGAKTYEKTRYSAITLAYRGVEETVALQAIKKNSEMVHIPTKGNENTPIPTDGITINMITAKNLGVKEGNYVHIAGRDEEVRVAYITQFEAYNASFCEYEKIADKVDEHGKVIEEGYSNNYVYSYLIKGINKEDLLKSMTNYHFDGMVTFTADQKNYFMSRFRVLEMCCIVFIIFATGLGALIVSLMMQTSLQEQRRDLCIMRSVGFSMGQINGIWSSVTILQYILACACAIPISFLTTKILLGFTATKMAMVLSYANWIHALITLAIVAFFLVFSQFFCMMKVKRWNIADNTKNRE